jgi:energy-coupling factor transport system ATP-binding protein
MMKKERKTILLVEHKVDLLAEYADTIMVLDNGRLACMGPAAEVLSDERIVDYGAQLPCIARLGNELTRRGLPLDRMPITEEDAVMTLKRSLGLP